MLWVWTQVEKSGEEGCVEAPRAAGHLREFDKAVGASSRQSAIKRVLASEEEAALTALPCAVVTRGACGKRSLLMGDGF